MSRRTSALPYAHHLFLLAALATPGGYGCACMESPEVVVCAPGEERSCYTGAPNTLGVGICLSGTQVCRPDRKGFGPCTGEVTPQKEDCETTRDEDCDNNVLDNEDGCVCSPGAARVCYTGPPGTEGVGICKGGGQLCSEDGRSYGDCIGEMTPQTESCAIAGDEDCDGDADDGCVCAPGANEVCYSGIPKTEGVGLCKPGVKFCSELGVDYGLCVGEVTPTAELCATPEDESCDGRPNCTGDSLWCRGIGDDGHQIGNGVAVDGSGNVVLTGFFTESINLGGTQFASKGGKDIFVAKLDSYGKHVWSRRFGSVGDDIGNSITVNDDGNVVVTGYFSDVIDNLVDASKNPLKSNGLHDVLIVQLDSETGATIWSRGFGGALNEEGAEIARDALNNVVVVGSYESSFSIGNVSLTNAGNRDLFVAKLDAAGTVSWCDGFGDAADQIASSVTIDNTGAIVVSGTLAGTISLAGNPPLTLTAQGDDDIFVVKFDPAGKAIWGKPFGDVSEQGGGLVATDAAGNIFLSGYAAGKADFGGGELSSPGGYAVPMVKLSPDGVHMWSKMYSSSQNGYGGTVMLDGAGNIILTGSLAGPLDFGGGPVDFVEERDIYIAKFSSMNGDHIWSKSFAAPGIQIDYGATVDPAGNIFITGKFEQSINCGVPPLQSNGLYDVFIAKLAP